MAITYGTHITNFDATPFERTNARQHGGVIKGCVDTFELADTANDDAHIVFKLPIDAILYSVKMAADDLGSAGTVDIGFHTKGADGTYTAVDVDAIASAIDVNAAATGLTEYRFEAADINTALETCWELAGLAARPAYEDIYLSISTPAGTTAVGTVTMQVQYAE